jgi:hypothetical protein
LLGDDFRALVEKTGLGMSKVLPLDMRMNKSRKFRRVSKGWSRNIEAKFRKLKRYIICE